MTNYTAAIAVILLFGWGVPAGDWAWVSDSVPILKSIDILPGKDHASGMQRDARAPTPGKERSSSSSPGDVAIAHGLRTIRKVALTFDACSTRQPSHYDEGITQVLLATHTPATLFLGGKWIEEKKEETKYLASLPGIEIGNHSHGHAHLTRISDERVREELLRTQQALIDVTGRKATLFRPPYGEHDERIVRIAAEMGLTTIEYDLPSGDPAKQATKEKLVEYVTSMARNGSIIVMHINGCGWHTAEALPDIIAGLRRRGFKLVTVGELLADLKKT